MKWFWIALMAGAGGYGLHAFATQLSAQPASTGLRPISAAEFAVQSRTDPHAFRRFVQSQQER